METICFSTNARPCNILQKRCIRFSHDFKSLVCMTFQEMQEIAFKSPHALFQHLLRQTKNENKMNVKHQPAFCFSKGSDDESGFLNLLQF